jgi:hypothetical protein
MLPAIQEAAKFNQLSFPILALCLAAVACLQRARPQLAGVLFAGAAFLKLLPGIFFLWLALKRRWLALITGTVAVVALTVLPPLIAFGPQDTLRYHQRWLVENVVGGYKEGVGEITGHFADHRNQSVPAVLRRTLQTDFPEPAPLQLAHWSQSTVTAVSLTLLVLLAGGLIYMNRQRWSALSPPERLASVAVFFIAMLVFSPLLRQYYLVWTFPAMMLLARRATEYDNILGRGTARVGLVVWVLGQLAWLSDYAREYGVHLLMLIVLGALLLRLGRLAAASHERVRANPVGTSQTPQSAESNKAPAPRPSK